MKNQELAGGDVFEIHSEPIEVTSFQKVDQGWRYVDPEGHEHRWVPVAPSASSGGLKRYTLPTLVLVKGPVEIDEYGDEHQPTHYECLLCSARVVPGYVANTEREFIAGIKDYRINGEHVSKDEFERRFNERQKEPR